MLYEFGPSAKKYVFSLFVLIQQFISSGKKKEEKEKKRLLIWGQRKRGGIHDNAMEMQGCVVSATSHFKYIRNTKLYELHGSGLFFVQ